MHRPRWGQKKKKHSKHSDTYHLSTGLSRCESHNSRMFFCSFVDFSTSTRSDYANAVQTFDTNIIQYDSLQKRERHNSFIFLVALFYLVLWHICCVSWARFLCFKSLSDRNFTYLVNIVTACLVFRNSCQSSAVETVLCVFFALASPRCYWIPSRQTTYFQSFREGGTFPIDSPASHCMRIRRRWCGSYLLLDIILYRSVQTQ